MGSFLEDLFGGMGAEGGRKPRRLFVESADSLTLKFCLVSVSRQRAATGQRGDVGVAAIFRACRAATRQAAFGLVLLDHRE